MAKAVDDKLRVPGHCLVMQPGSIQPDDPFEDLDRVTGPFVDTKAALSIPFGGFRKIRIRRTLSAKMQRDR